MIRLPPTAIELAGELVAWVRGRRQRMRIEGRSMHPTLAPGDMVLVDPDRRPTPEDLVAARPPALGGQAVVKRLVRFDADGGAHLSSDNPAEGTDSRRWGPVPVDCIDGVVTVDLTRRRLLTRGAEPGPPSTGRWLRR